MTDSSLILISAYAKLPANITVEEVYKTMVVAVVIDTDTDSIIKAEASLVTDVSKNFIASLLIGYKMEQGPNRLLEQFDETYYGHSKKAIETAIKMIFNKYEEVKSRQRLKQVLQGGKMQ